MALGVTQLAFPGHKPRHRLFRTIGTVYYEQDRLLRDLLSIHGDGQIDLDCTYGQGAAYRSKMVKRPQIRTDLVPRRRGVIPADVHALPFPSASLMCVFFDPPFLAEGGHRGIMNLRYTTAVSLEALVALYRGGLRELARVLDTYGILIFKSMDSVHDHLQVPYHAAVILHALPHDLYLKDLFILANESGLVGGNAKKQHHARKRHCYFLVFQKHPHYAGRVRTLLGLEG